VHPRVTFDDRLRKIYVPSGGGQVHPLGLSLTQKMIDKAAGGRSEQARSYRPGDVCTYVLDPTAVPGIERL
jgi:hypothetical protein